MYQKNGKMGVLKMNKIDEEKLVEFFNAWKNVEHSRYLSWEYCYNFFKNNKNKIIEDENMLDLASLNLAFYLASWGMYRGSSNLLRKDYKVHSNLIKQLIDECSDLWNEDITWEQLEKAKNIIVDYYSFFQISATDTLITKILMGMFACVPAYDNFVKNALRANHIQQKFNETSYNQLKDIAKTINKRAGIKDYPPMRLLDAYYWWTGGGKEAHEKSANI